MKKLLIIATTMVLLPLSSFAQEAFYASGMLGLTNVDTGTNGLELKSELSFGARAGLLFNDHFSAGVYINRYAGKDSNAAGTGQSVEATLTNLMAEVTYYFAEADENSFWVSGLLGTTQNDLTCPAGFMCENTNDTSYGASVGYHFMVAPNFSVGPQATYIHVDTDRETSSMTTVTANLTLWL